jgi:hypothetical protein
MRWSSAEYALIAAALGLANLPLAMLGSVVIPYAPTVGLAIVVVQGGLLIASAVFLVRAIMCRRSKGGT